MADHLVAWLYETPTAVLRPGPEFRITLEWRAEAVERWGAGSPALSVGLPVGAVIGPRDMRGLDFFENVLPEGPTLQRMAAIAGARPADIPVCRLDADEPTGPDDRQAVRFVSTRHFTRLANRYATRSGEPVLLASSPPSEPGSSTPTQKSGPTRTSPSTSAARTTATRCGTTSRPMPAAGCSRASVHCL